MIWYLLYFLFLAGEGACSSAWHFVRLNLWDLLSRVHVFFSNFIFFYQVFSFIFSDSLFTFPYLMNFYLCLRSKSRWFLFCEAFSDFGEKKKKQQQQQLIISSTITQKHLAHIIIMRHRMSYSSKFNKFVFDCFF